MLEVSLLLMLLTIICKLLITYIKAIRTGDPNESELTYWMFSYDFKSVSYTHLTLPTKKIV